MGDVEVKATGSRWPTLVIVLACWGLGMAWLWVSQVEYDPWVQAVGPDSYLRLFRVSMLWETGDWFGQFTERINAPFGYEMHWTRPLDALLLMGALPLTPILGFDRALWTTGMVLSPILFLGAYGVFLWVASPLLNGSSRRVAALVFFAQFAVLSHALPARVDQEMLLLLGVLLVAGLGFRLLLGTASVRRSMLVGAACGLSIWLSVELLATVGLLAGALAGAWVREGALRARQGVAFAAGFFPATLFGVLVEHSPVRWFAVEYDKVSVAYAGVAAGLLLFWALLWRLAPRSDGWPWPRRLAVVLPTAGILALGLVWLFPGLLENPLLEQYPRLGSIWVDKIEEFQPLAPGAGGGFGRSLIYLGSALFALPACAYFTWRRRHEEGWSIWVFLSTLTVFFLIMSLRHYRFALFYQAIAGLPLTVLLARVLEASASMRSGYRQAATQLLSLPVVLLGPFVLGVALGVKERAAEAPAGEVLACDMAAMSEFLGGWPEGEPVILLANLGFGAEIVYRTHHAVVGDVTHRNARGILDTYDFFSAVDGTQAREVADARSVDAVLVCLDPSERKFFIREDGRPSLFDRLREGDAPPWLDPVGLPPELQRMFRLYRLNAAAD